MRKKSDESCTTGRKRHILCNGVFFGAESKSKRKQKIRQMFPFQKGQKFSKNANFQHFLTALAYTAVRLHNILHIEAFGDAESKFKRKQNIQ